MDKWKLITCSLVFCCLLCSPAFGDDLLEELLGIKLTSPEKIEDGQATYGLIILRRHTEIRPLFDFGLGIFPPPAKDQAPAAVVVRVKGNSKTSQQVLGGELSSEIARFTDQTEDLFFRVISGITGQHTYYPTGSGRSSRGLGLGSETVAPRLPATTGTIQMRREGGQGYFALKYKNIKYILKRN